MRGITTAVFFTVCVFAVVSAAPSNKKWGKNEARVDDDDSEGGIYPSDRTRPSSPRRGGPSEGRSNTRGGQGPYLFFREPKAIGGVPSSPWGRRPIAVGNKPWPRYIQGRDDEEDDDEDDEDAEDDIQDDEGGSDEDEYAFDTPSWDDIYPKEETGPYAQRNAPIQQGQGQQWNSVQGQQWNQQSQGQSGGYSLSPGTPGSSGYQGRSGFNRAPSKAWQQRNWQGEGPWATGGRRQVRQRRPIAWVRVPKQGHYEDQDVEGPPPSWSRWSAGSSSSAGNWNSGSPAVYYRQRPQYVRRSWNWRPSQRPIQVESEEESGEVAPPQVWSSAGPRRLVKSWARTQPPTWQGRQQKWGYY